YGAVPRDERDEVPASSSHGRADTELTRARSHDEREQAVDPERRHEQRQRGKRRKKLCLYFATGDLSIDNALERANTGNRLIRIDGPDLALHRRRERCRIQRRSNRKRAGAE